MSSITRNNFSIHSNLKGNLLKTEYQKDGIVYFVKSGRLQVRDFPEKWGIEPVIEVLCYEIGKLMGLNVAEQSLIGMEGIRYGKNFQSLSMFIRIIYQPFRNIFNKRHSRVIQHFQ